MIDNDKLKKIITDSLGYNTDTDVIQESYVTQPKQFNITTDFLSKKNILNHLELYDAYSRSFNEVSAELDTASREDANSNHSKYRSLKIDETYNLNAFYLHELYFANIAAQNSQISMDSLSYMRLARDFGTFDDWQKDFIACCMISRCGWAMTYLNMYTKTYMNCAIDLHSLNVPMGCYPVIVMDMWQHAYYKDYLKDVKTYVYAMMKQLRWPLIEKRFEKADRVLEALK